jgi:hypothetical protein
MLPMWHDAPDQIRKLCSGQAPKTYTELGSCISSEEMKAGVEPLSNGDEGVADSTSPSLAKVRPWPPADPDEEVTRKPFTVGQGSAWL